MKKLFVTILALLVTSAAFSQQKTLLDEDFSDNDQNWTIRDNDKATAEIGKDGYRMVHHKPAGSYLYLTDFSDLDPNQDFSIVTHIRQFQGSETDGFGLVWGCQDAGNFFGFNINGASQFRVYKYQNQNYSEIRSFTTALNAVRGKGLPNTLAIRKVGGLLSFYVNDSYVFSMPFQKFMGAKIGYVLYNQTEVHAKDLLITQGRTMPLMREEAFVDNSGQWIRNKEDSTLLRLAKSNLYMRTQDGDKTTYRLYPGDIDINRDFELEVNVRQVQGRKNKGYGLVWGAENDKNLYAFLINSFGSFAVFKKENGKMENLVDWTPSNQLLHLSIQPNKLVVRKIGDRYAFYLNDIWLAEIPYREPFGDRIGFVATADLRIEIASLAVRQGETSYIPQPPVVTLLKPGSPNNTIDTRALDIEAGILSRAKISEVKLFVNGEPVLPKLIADTSGTYRKMLKQAVALEEGKNEIRLEVLNADNLTHAVTAEVTVNTPDQPIVRNGNDYALFFATDEYEFWSDLVNPVNDTRTIARELEQHYGFNTELVIGATRREILKTLKQYARREYGPNDQLLIFFAGHGKFDEFFGEGYVVCTNSEKDDEGNEGYLSHSSLRTIVNNIPCEHTFLMMDVCFGGTIDPFIAQGLSRGGNNGGGGGGKELTQTEFIERKLRFKTRKYLTSGGKEYVPDGTPGQHSPFARKFLEALRNYGGHDKIITTGELVLYFERIIPEPRFGEFGTNEPGSDFLFIAR